MASPSRCNRGFGAEARGAVWEVGLVSIPAFVAEPDGSDVRPVIALVMEAGGAIRASAVSPADQPLQALESAIANALRDPQPPCRPGSPQRVVVNRAELLQWLPPLLPGVLISQGATPQLDQASQVMRERLAGREDQRGTHALTTYLTRDIGPEAVTPFFEAVAALYCCRPWERIPGDGHLFQLNCAPLAIQGWVGCVIGQQHEHHGLLLFQSRQDYERYVELGDRFEAGERDALDATPPYRAINFEAKADMPPPLLKEIKRHGWPLAPGNAYPTVMLIEPPAVLKPPCRAELKQLEAVARALVAWIEAEPRIARLWRQPAATQQRFTVEVDGEPVTLTIGVVPLDAPPVEPPAAPAAPGTTQDNCQGARRPQGNRRQPADAP